MYLKDRRPVVLTHNPFMAFQDDPRPEYNTQVCKRSYLWPKDKFVYYVIAQMNKNLVNFPVEYEKASEIFKRTANTEELMWKAACNYFYFLRSG